MAKFVYLYTGGQMAETPEAQEAAMQEWGRVVRHSALKLEAYGQRVRLIRGLSTAGPLRAEGLAVGDADSM